MGRRLAGPVKLPNSGDNWYARLTVKPSLRPVAACTRLLRSLGTTDHSIALQRWPDAYKALEQELQLRIQHANADSQRFRTWIRAKLPLVWDCPEGLTTVEWTENLTGERLDHSDDATPLFQETWAALESKRTLSLNWPELVELHAETIARRRGESLSQSWFKAARQAVKRVLEVNELPDTITKE